MSGIAVIWNREGRPVDRDLLVQMTRKMAHRGPDRAGHHFSGSIGLGHCMLATTPEAWSEEEPLLDEARDLCLTFDGRIDNRTELRSHLEADGGRLETESDAELVLAAYRKWGADCPSRLLGDFAFAIWDERRKRLFCARDPLGVRPFFYATVGDTFVCASEMRALFALPGLKKEPALAVIVWHLLRKFVEFDETIYRGVYRLPLAHCLTVTPEVIRRSRYWNIDPERTIRYRNDSEYAEHFRELFFEAVRCRLRSRGPVAAMLSGGVDSSSIVCAAQRIRRDLAATEPGFETFSMVFDGFPTCDERPFISAVTRHCGAKGNLHICDSDPSDAALARRVRYPDVPYSPQALLIASMLEEIQLGHFRVLLDGTGGDELAGPRLNHLSEMMWHGNWRRLFSFIDEYSRTWGISRWRLFVRSCLGPSIPEPLKVLKRRLAPRTTGLSLVRNGAVESSGAGERLRHPLPTPDFASPRHKEMHGLTFSGPGPTFGTDSYQLLASYFGIEIRQPFRDRRLVEFAFALPNEQLWRDGWSRFGFRNAMKGIVPEEVLQRTGKGMFVPLYESILAGSQAKEVASLFDNSALVELGLADAETLQKLVNGYQTAPAFFSTQIVSDLVSLELQCRDILGAPAGTGDSIAVESRTRAANSSSR